MVGERVPTEVDIASAGRVIFNPDMNSSVFSSEIVAHRRGKWLIGLCGLSIGSDKGLVWVILGSVNDSIQ